jgi:rhodanese-related sulfurtransferase
MAITEISVAELQGLLPNIVLIDVRETDEYLSGHVPGAISVPLSTVQNNVEPFLSQKPTYVICQAGGRSMRACEFAEQSGAECINIARVLVRCQHGHQAHTYALLMHAVLLSVRTSRISAIRAAKGQIAQSQPFAPALCADLISGHTCGRRACIADKRMCID